MISDQSLKIQSNNSLCYSSFEQSPLTQFDEIESDINLSPSIYANDDASLSISSTTMVLFRPHLVRFSGNNNWTNYSLKPSNDMAVNLQAQSGDASAKIKRRQMHKLSLINPFNCFKFFNSKPKRGKNKGNKVGTLIILKKSEPFDEVGIVKENYTKKESSQLCTVMHNNADNCKMDSPIIKETEKLLFVASRFSVKQLIGPQSSEDRNKKCCVIDLDETLVHSSFKEIPEYDFKVSVDIEGTYYDIFIVKRPYVDVFLKRMGQLFECVLFTASLRKYANLVINILDKGNIFRWRLFRESCVYYRGSFVKDLAMLGRPIDQIVILDNSPISFLFNIKNAVHIISWFSDPQDRALLDIIPFCEKLANSPSVINFLQIEEPPLSSALPHSHHIFINSEIPTTSKLGLSDSAASRADLNPISSISSDLDKPIPSPMRVKQGSRSARRNYSDKQKLSTLSSIRSFLPKGSSESQINSLVPTHSTATSSSIKSKALLDFDKSNTGASSTSSGKEAVIRTTLKNAPPAPVAFNSSIKQQLDSTK